MNKFIHDMEMIDFVLCLRRRRNIFAYISDSKPKERKTFKEKEKNQVDIIKGFVGFFSRRNNKIQRIQYLRTWQYIEFFVFSLTLFS